MSASEPAKCYASLRNLTLLPPAFFRTPDFMASPAAFLLSSPWFVGTNPTTNRSLPGCRHSPATVPFLGERKVIAV